MIGARLLSIPFLLGAAAPVAAQCPAGLPRLAVGAEQLAGSELDRYLRVLQSREDAPVSPVGLRPHAPRMLDGLVADTGAAHPWRCRYRLGWGAGAGPRFALVRPTVSGRWNSDFPVGGNEFGVWSGRGATLAARGGIAMRWGPLSATVAPVVYHSRNRPFPLAPHGLPDSLRFLNPTSAFDVDFPQRFGDRPFTEVSPGESTVQVEGFGLAGGVSTASMWWGPATTFPFLLSNNAPGIPRLFVGTGRPADLWIADAQVLVWWGRLGQSDYFQPTGLARPTRFGTALGVTLQPRGLRTLELGLLRFAHAPMPDGRIPTRYWTRLVEPFSKERLPVRDGASPDDERSVDGENQLAALYLRWLFPRSGFEFFVELGKEDHPWNFSEVLLIPEEKSSRGFGVRKTWKGPEDRRTVARFEMIDFQRPTMERFRGGAVIYIHESGSNQGHTHRGMLLGANVGVANAAGAVLGVDRYDRTGRWGASWTRQVRRQVAPATPATTLNENAVDVLHGIAVERLFFRGATDVLVGANAGWNLNRDFLRDARNLSLYLSVTPSF